MATISVFMMLFSHTFRSLLVILPPPSHPQSTGESLPPGNGPDLKDIPSA